MTHRGLTHEPPVVGDPVVVDGRKYRIRSIDLGVVQARTSFGNHWAKTRVGQLAWDKVAGVWRER